MMSDLKKLKLFSDESADKPMEGITELPLRYAYEFYADQHRWIRIFSTAEGQLFFCLSRLIILSRGLRTLRCVCQ